MTFQPITFAPVVAQSPDRGPERRAEPKAGAKASRGQSVGSRASATAAGGGLGNTASIAAGQSDTFVSTTPRGAREASILLRNVAQNLVYPVERVNEVMRLPDTVQRFQRCGRVAKGPYGILTLAENGKAGTSNVETCGRTLICPRCAVQVREERRQILLSMMSTAREQEIGVYFATLTLRHYQRHSLEQSLSVIRGAMHRITGSRQYRKYAKLYGLGFVSAVEFTWSKRHGFHPHLHLAFFQGVPPVAKGDAHQWVKTGSKVGTWSPMEENGFVDWFRTTWLSIVEGSELPDADQRYAFDWRPALGTATDEGVSGELSDYLLKDQGVVKGLKLCEEVLAGRAENLNRANERPAEGMTFEMMRADLKTSSKQTERAEHSTLPMFEVLGIAFANDGKGSEARAWFEYEKATRGLRWYRVSHGLAAALGTDIEATRSDEQIIEDRQAVGVPVIEVEAKSWYAMVRAGHLPALLNTLEGTDRPVAERVEIVLNVLLGLGYLAQLAGEYSESLMKWRQQGKAPPI